MLALDPDGGEIDRVPMHVRSYGYVWSGTVADDGVHWKPASHSDDERTFPPEEGLETGSSRRYLKSFDPRTEAVDSVFLGERTYRSYVAPRGRGWSYRSIPFDAGGGLAIDPTGGFWTSDGRSYRIARLDAQGDTVLVVEADVPALPVTTADREAFVDAMSEQDPDFRSSARAIMDLAPDTKPVISGLRADAEGRLWVLRSRAGEDDPTYDVFQSDGAYVGSVRLGFEALDFFPFVVRNGALHTLTRDSLDVPTVVRAQLPPFIDR